MSVDSPAEVIPFERFLECRERRRRMAAATGTVVMPASTDLMSIQPELTERAKADHADSPRCIGNRLVDA
jgi:hypothetical protein